jgi:glutamate synthase (NADPH/NADH) large chain
MKPAISNTAAIWPWSERFEHQQADLETHGRVDIRHDMTRDDARRLRTLIEQHRHYTGSQRARDILEHWADYLPRFVKVMPVDYRAALRKIQAEQTASQTATHA